MKKIDYLVIALAAVVALASILGFVLWSTSSFAQQEWIPGTVQNYYQGTEAGAIFTPDEDVAQAQQKGR